MFDPQRLGAKAAGARKCAIVGKDGARGNSSQIVLLGEGQVLLSFGGDVDYPGKPSGFQVRAGAALTLVADVPGSNRPLAVRAGGGTALDPILGQCPQSDWLSTHLRLTELPSGTVLERLPLGPPVAWLDRNRFVAMTTGLRDGQPFVSAELRERYPWVVAALDPERPHGPVLVDLDRQEAELVAGGRGVPWVGSYRLTADPARGVLYFGDWTHVAALDLQTRAMRWQTALAPSWDYYSLRDIAVSLDGAYVAAIASRADPAQLALVILASESGAVVHSRPLGRELAALGLLSGASTALRCLTWHPGGWLAVGTSSGVVAHLDRAWNLRAYKASPRGVEALAFTEDGRELLVAGCEKAVRRWELLPDEIG